MYATIVEIQNKVIYYNFKTISVLRVLGHHDDEIL